LKCDGGIKRHGLQLFKDLSLSWPPRLILLAVLVRQLVYGRRSFNGSAPAPTVTQLFLTPPRALWPTGITPSVPLEVLSLRLYCCCRGDELWFGHYPDVKEAGVGGTSLLSPRGNQYP